MMAPKRILLLLAVLAVSTAVLAAPYPAGEEQEVSPAQEEQLRGRNRKICFLF